MGRSSQQQQREIEWKCFQVLRRIRHHLAHSDGVNAQHFRWIFHITPAQEINPPTSENGLKVHLGERETHDDCRDCTKIAIKERTLKMSLALCCDDSVSRKYLYKTPFHTARCEMEIKSMSYKNVFRKIFRKWRRTKFDVKLQRVLSRLVVSVVFSLGQWTTDGRKSSRFKIKLQLIDSCFSGENFFRLIRHLSFAELFPTNLGYQQSFRS